MLMICTSAEVLAQWKFSAIAGPSLSNFGGADKKEWGGTDTNPKVVLRFHLGLLADYTISEKISLSGGIQYSTKGARYKGETEYYDMNTNSLAMVSIVYTKRLAYLDFPILVNYRLSDQFDLLLGLQPSILVSAKVKNDENAQKAFELPETEDVKDNYKTFDIAILIGPRYRINDRIAVQFLYNYGLAKIAHAETYDFNGGMVDKDYKVMNRVLKFSVAYTFNQ
jgi:hypothetical protein